MRTNFSTLQGKFLYKFLKQNRCLDKFVKAVIAQHPSNLDIATYNATKNIMDLLTSFDDIDYSILWNDTKEGYDFWNQLNNQFLSKYRAVDFNIFRMHDYPHRIKS